MNLIYDSKNTLALMQEALPPTKVEIKTLLTEQLTPIVSEIIIGWENYKENYVKVTDDIDDMDDINEDEDEFIDTMPFKVFNMNGMEHLEAHYTPWGKFEAENPLSPINFYELSLAHFTGFTVKSFSDFNNIMVNVDGLALYKIVDPYCVVIAPAKSYEVTDVKINFERAIYKALNLTIADSTNLPPEVDEGIFNAQQKSMDLAEAGQENLTIVFTNPEFAVEVKELNEENLLAVNRLFLQVEDLYVFRNGEYYYWEEDGCEEEYEEENNESNKKNRENGEKYEE